MLVDDCRRHYGPIGARYGYADISVRLARERHDVRLLRQRRLGTITAITVEVEHVFAGRHRFAADSAECLRHRAYLSYGLAALVAERESLPRSTTPEPGRPSAAHPVRPSAPASARQRAASGMAGGSSRGWLGRRGSLCGPLAHTFPVCY